MTDQTTLRLADGSHTLTQGERTLHVPAGDDLQSAQRGFFDVEPLRQLKLAALADTRWARQQTCNWGGREAVPADDVAAGRIGNAVLLMQVSGTTGSSVNWKFGPGDFQAMTYVDLVGYGGAIAAHLQACFDHEATLAAQIVAAEDPSAIDIDAGWPG